METKHCRKCASDKPRSEFHKDSNAKSGLTSYCKECNTAKARQWTKDNPDRVLAHSRKRATEGKFRSYNLARKYGMTDQMYAEMLQTQGGGCAICGTDDPGRGNKHFHVDHDHTSNLVRGLLCNNCNRGIGLLQDSVEVLERAAKYVRRSR